MIIDGVLDPVAWSTGGAGDGKRAVLGADRAAAYGACTSLDRRAATSATEWARRAADRRASAESWHDVMRKLRNRKGDQYPTYQDVVGTALGSLYDARSIGYLMRNLGALHQEVVRQEEEPPAVRRVRPASSARARRRRHSRALRRVPGHQHFLLRSRLGPVPRGCLCRLGQPCQPAGLGGRGQARGPALAVVRRAPGPGASSGCAGWPAPTRADRFTGPLRRYDHRPRRCCRWATPTTRRPRCTASAPPTACSTDPALAGDGRRGHGAIDTGPCISDAYRDDLIDGTLPVGRHRRRGSSAGAVPGRSDRSDRLSPLHQPDQPARRTGPAAAPGSGASSSRAWAATLCSTSTS